MITIHHEKETDFSKNGYGAIDDYVMSQEVTWEMNGQFYAYLEYPAFLDKSAYLVNKNILRVPVPFMEDQLFRIYRVRKVLGFIQVEARHIFYDLMDNLIEDTNIVGKTGSQAIQQLLGATQYEHRFIGFSDISTSNNARMVRYNPVEALLDDSKANTFVSRWGGEVVRDNFVIRMVRQMGTDRGVRIQHRKDLTAYIATIDESTVVTRIMPVGFDGLKLPELYIDSPLLDPDNPKIGVIRYENVKAAIGEYADDNGAVPLEEAYELLREHARAEFNTNHLDEPEMTVTVNFVTLHNTKEYAGFAQLQEIHQGDVVRVSVPEEGFEITSRLVAFTSDPLQQNHYTSTTLGNHVYEFTSSTNSVSTLRNEVEALRESVVEVRQSANGKNQSFWGEADPNTLNLNAILGDTYFRSVGEEDVIYQYVEVDGERYWKEIINTANTSEVKKEVERVAEEAEKLANDITEAQQSADDAKRDAGLALTASEALEIITQETASQLSDTRGLLATVESNASEALSQASGAITQAGQAVLDAQTAMGDAQSALSKASGVESTVSTLSSEFDEVAGKVELKADKSEVDTLSGTVSTHTTTLSQHATAISSKATQSEVDTVKGTVSNHTSTLSQHAKDISARLTQSQVDNLVSGKGYSTVSYVDAEMTATASAIRTEMTKVEGKIDGLEIGGRNLIPDSEKEVEIINTTTTREVTKSTGTFNAEGNQTYIFSAEVFIDDNVADSRVQIHYLPTDIDYEVAYKEVTPNTWTKITWQFATTQDKTDAYIRFDNDGSMKEGLRSVVKFRKVKLEKGNKATDWSPAPEDMLNQSDFNTFKAEYEQSAEGWSSKLLQIEQADYASKTWSNQTFATPQSVTTQLSSYAKTSALNGMVTETTLANKNFATASSVTTQLQSYAKTTALNGLATETYVGSQISATAGTIRSEITAVENKIPTEIGGRNLIEGSNGATQSNMDYWTRGGASSFVRTYHPFYKNATESVFRLSTSGTAEVYATSNTRVYVESNTTYTFSMVGFMDTNVHSIDIHFLMRRKGETSNFTTTRAKTGIRLSPSRLDSVTWTFTTPNISDLESGYIRIDNNGSKTQGSGAAAFFTNVKLEKGKVATDWTPAPEDMATSKQVSSIEQKADSIQALVGTTKESVARAVMTSSLWETEVTDVIQSQLAETTTTESVYVEATSRTGLTNLLLGGSYSSSIILDPIRTAEMLMVYVDIEPKSSGTGNGTIQVEYGGVTSSAVTVYKSLGRREYLMSISVSADSSRSGLFRFPYSFSGLYDWGTIRGVRVEKATTIQVPTGTGAISSKITQLYDQISLALTGSDGQIAHLIANASGVSIKGEIINLDGKVKMDEGFARKFMVEEMTADTVEAFTGTFANVIANNIDVNNIAGNKASFIQLLLNGTNTALRATSSVVDIMRNDGSISTRLTQNGMEIWRDGSKVGDFESRSSISESGALANKKSISMTPERDSYISLGYYKSGETTSTRVLSVAGDTGRIYIGSALYPSESSTYGLQIQRFTLNGSGGIRVGSTGGSSGIFFGDFGHVSIQFNGIWYAMDRLIN